MLRCSQPSTSVEEFVKCNKTFATAGVLRVLTQPPTTTPPRLQRATTQPSSPAVFQNGASVLCWVRCVALEGATWVFHVHDLASVNPAVKKVSRFSLDGALLTETLARIGRLPQKRTRFHLQRSQTLCEHAASPRFACVSFVSVAMARLTAIDVVIRT